MLKNFKFNFTTDKVTFPCKNRQLKKTRYIPVFWMRTLAWSPERLLHCSSLRTATPELDPQRSFGRLVSTFLKHSLSGKLLLDTVRYVISHVLYAISTVANPCYPAYERLLLTSKQLKLKLLTAQRKFDIDSLRCLSCQYS